MKYRQLVLSLLHIMSACLALPSTVQADHEAFLDELSTNALFLSTTGSNASVTAENNLLLIDTNSVGGEDARVSVWIAGDSDSVEVTFSVKSDSDFVGSSSGRLGLFATLYNDTLSGGHNETDGDMVAGIRVYRNSGEALSSQFCLWRRLSDGQWVSSAFFNGGSCTSTAVALVEDVQYQASISIDRQTSTLSYQLGSLAENYSVTGGGNYPAARQNFIEQKMTNLTGHMNSEIHELKTAQIDSTLDGTFTTINSQYILLHEKPGEGRFEWDSGQVKLTATTDGVTNNRTRIRVVSSSDILKARVKISSETDITGTTAGQRFTGAVAGLFYNDTQDGGFNGLEGDVFATSELVAEVGGGLIAKYCASTSTSPDFSTLTGLLNGGLDECVSYALTPLHDTYYDLSVGIDIAAKKLLFSIDGETASYDIQTPIFIASEDYHAVRATAFNGAGAGDLGGIG